MRKYALLIGVDTYGEGLQPLPAASKDVAALREVLLNPKMGGFDEAKPVINPTRREMAREIELWFQDRQPEDLVLLFFSGHGVKDDRRDLYFAAADTEKQRNRLLTSTATSARLLHDWIRVCKAKYQVLILDCCFSGAFGDLVGKDDGKIPLQEQLGAEGRVVLASTSAVDYSFQEKDADLSTYTRYLVEGIEGAADDNGDGQITVDELHRYVKQKVSISSPAMSPTLITLRGQGFRIPLVRVSQRDDPELAYRKQAEQLAKGPEFTGAARRILTQMRRDREIPDSRAEAIEAEVLEPFRTYQRKQKEYEEELRDFDQSRKGLSLNRQLGEIEDLKQLRTFLGLKSKDADALERGVFRCTLDTLLKRIKLGIKLKPFIGPLVGCSLVILGLVVYRYMSSPPNPPPSAEKARLDKARKELITSGENTEFLGLGGSHKDEINGAVQKFSTENYGDAQTAFDDLYEKLKEDKDPRLPQLLIFRNNACVRERQQPRQPIYTIVAAGPITGDALDTGAKMLRGIAQAQDEAVKCDPDKQYPNSVPKVNLQVLLADDLNDPDQAGSLAQVLIENRGTFNPLAVVGHYISDATCKALEQGYREAGIPVIAPLSTRTDLRKDCGGDRGPNYVFRNTSSTAVEAMTIVGDIKRRFASPNPNVAIFYNPDDSFSRDLFIEVKSLINLIDRDQAVNITAERQLKDINNPSNSLQESGIMNSNILIVLPDGKNKDSTSFNNAVELIKANRGERLVYGSNPLYNNEDVVQPLLNSIGLNNLRDRFFIPTDWHKDCGSEDLGNRSQQYWGGTVDRVTALSYEAVYVLLAGLRGEVTRDTLGTYLTDLGTQTTDNFVKSPIFDDKTVSFDPDTGDRNEIQERVLTTIGDNPQDPFVVVDNRCL